MPLKPFPLEKLSVDLQRRVVEKLSFLEYCRLRRSSIFGENICESNREQITFDLRTLIIDIDDVRGFRGTAQGHVGPEIMWEEMTMWPCRISTSTIQIGGNLTSDRIAWMSSNFQALRLESEQIEIKEGTLCTPEELIELFKIVGSNRLIVYQTFPPHFLEYSFFHKISMVRLLNCNISGDSFLDLTAPSVHANGEHISVFTFAELVRQWHEGKREVVAITLQYKRGIQDAFHKTLQKELADILNPVWSPEYHSLSLLRNMKLDSVCDPDYRPYAFYCLWRKDNIRETYIIKVSKVTLVFFRGTTHDCFSNIMCGLSFYVSMGPCKMCGVKCCCHQYDRTMVKS